MNRKLSIFLLCISLLLSTVFCTAVFPQQTPDLEPTGDEQPANRSAATRTLVPTYTPAPVDPPTPTQPADPPAQLTTEPTQNPEPLPTLAFDYIPRTHPEAMPEVNFGLVESSTPEENRPELTGPELSVSIPHFRIHFTLEGTDAVNANDRNNNDIPDYVEDVGKVLEYIRDTSINYFGWAAPPSDGTAGGDDLYDVYLMDVYNTDDSFGYVDGGYNYTKVRDNPNSEVIETRAHHSYMVLDNDYIFEEEYGYPPTTIMQTTAGHEFMHSLQFGYDGEEPAEWLWEATATWFQDELFNDINDGNNDLVSVFKSPDTCLQAYGGEERIEDEYHWYGLWIYIRYISENYGHQAVRLIWENAILLNGFTALDTTFRSLGTNFDEVFLNYSLALLSRGFEEGQDYPTIRLEGATNYEGLFVPVDGVGQTAADYVQIETSGIVTLRLNTEEQMIPVVVGFKDGKMDVFTSSHNEITLDSDNYDYLYMIVVNTDRARNEIECRFMHYTINIRSSGEPTMAPAWQLDAPNFLPPEVEGLQSTSDLPVDESEVPQEYIPAWLPEGFSLSGAYVLNKEELPAEDADWWMPGEGPGWQLDYDHGDGRYITVAASESPFASLDDFYAFVGVDPLDDDVRIINNTQVYFIAYDDGSEPYFDAIFISDNNFFAVFGELDYTDFEAFLIGMLNQ